MKNIHLIELGFAYCILQIVLYIIERRYVHKIINNQNGQVFLIDRPEKGITNKISQLMEYGILNRYSFFGYKNAVRSNNRIIASLLTTIFVFITLLGIKRYFLIHFSDTFRGTIAMSLAGFCISLFVIERQILYSKWQYLSEVMRRFETEGDNEKRKTLCLSLLQDLISMEMWSHRSFKIFFSSIIHQSLYYNGTVTTIHQLSLQNYSESESQNVYSKADLVQSIQQIQKEVMTSTIRKTFSPEVIPDKTG